MPCGASASIVATTLVTPGTAASTRRGDANHEVEAYRGLRTYVAVRGGVAVEPVLGSRSTYALGALGGHEGRKLQAGDQLPVGTIGKDASDTTGECVKETVRLVVLLLPPTLVAGTSHGSS